jgi:hypothetical protein
MTFVIPGSLNVIPGSLNVIPGLTGDLLPNKTAGPQDPAVFI